MSIYIHFYIVNKSVQLCFTDRESPLLLKIEHKGMKKVARTKGSRHFFLFKYL